MRLHMCRVSSQDVPGVGPVVLADVPLPKRGTEWAAGYDLFTPVPISLSPGEQTFVPLGIVWQPDKCSFTYGSWLYGGFFAKIFDRSGLAFKCRFSTLAGVIDQDYFKPWGLICRNEDPNRTFVASVGDKVAQFVLLPFLVAEDLEDGPIETRSGGFGSTGR
jgi:dUTP pyrophosphatase